MSPSSALATRRALWPAERFVSAGTASDAIDVPRVECRACDVSGQRLAHPAVEVRVFGINASNRLVGVFIALVLACVSAELRAGALAVRYTEGVVHGFLTLRTLDGHVIADGDLTQVAHGTRVASR